MCDVNTCAKSPSKDAAAPVVDKSINRYNIMNMLFYIINSICTYAVQFGWVDLPDNGTLSDKYETIITPWGKAFLIWSVIFMWQLFWAVWQFLPSQRNSEGVIRAWYYYPIFTCFQAGWTFSFANEVMWLQLIFMYGLLITLISASMSLQKYKKTWKGYLIWQFPFSIQTGWIMAASCLATNVVPVYYEANATTKIVVASLCLGTLIITAFTWLSSYPVDFAIPCVIVWALCGVYMKLNNPLPIIPETFSEKQINGVQYAVIAGIALVGTGIVAKALYVLLKQRPEALKAEEKEIASASESEEASSEKPSAEESV
jgi:hypothetical protein